MNDENAPRVPPKSAAALAYQAGASAPKVVAKGRGLVADQIIARAREHGVFVHESRELVALLMQVELDQHIPPALYRAVAELLAWLYHIEEAKSKGTAMPPGYIEAAPPALPDDLPEDLRQARQAETEKTGP
ncbi:EscU/YscU/HrcU family type III secretion system export apparatus switch protein [Massilia sp. W12]|uniref:EscU/YscU/HrcU family type III secretion system export apparatus switch protein n=1 Tax=Massilia sp. W12 TaxID=3126507 RepID=UPI0030D449BB